MPIRKDASSRTTTPPSDRSLRSESYPELLSLAVHELRSPAGVVSGYLRMLQRETDPALTERQRKMVDEAEKSCARFVALVSELSEISKLDAGLVTLTNEPLDLLVLVHEVAKDLPKTSEPKIRLETRGEKAGASMSGDPARLRGAFAAIFKAVLREQPAGYTVVVDCRVERTRGAHSVTVVVAEEGSVQEAYDASPAPFDAKRGGVGLALPIARRVIEGHGGRLWSPLNSQERGAALVSLPLTELNR